MTPLRLVFLSQIYSPEPEFRVHLLARGLASRGHRVTAITGFPNYPLGRYYDGYPLAWRRWEYKDGVRVLRLPVYPDHTRSGARRAACYLSLAASASVLGPMMCGPADLVWVYTPPITNAIPGWWISALRGVPFVLEIQDMWPETLAATGVGTSAALQRGIGAFARWAYGRAGAMTVVSPGLKRNLIDKGVPAGKVEVIPNWADEDLYRPVAPDAALARHHGLQERFNVIYAGNMGPAQALVTVLDAAALLLDRPDVQFVFVGDGLDKASLERMAVQRGLRNVRFLPREPVERMPALFALAGALLVHLKADPLFEITIPSKTQTYLAAGRPIIMGVAGDAADLVAQAGAGVLARPGDAADLARAVREVAGLSPQRREAMGRAGREFFMAHLSQTVLLDRYEELFQRMVSGTEHA